MSDIVYDLRRDPSNGLDQAAASEIERLKFELKAAQEEIKIADGEIERLRAENTELKAALQTLYDMTGIEER